MKHWLLMALLVPVAALAESPQVEQNTQDIAALQAAQAADEQKLGLLKIQASANRRDIDALQAGQATQDDGIAALEAGQAAFSASQALQDERITALELTDPVPPGPAGEPGNAPPGVSLAAAQIQSALDLTSGLRWLVADHYRRNGAWPLDNAAAGAEPPTAWSNRYVAGAQTYQGVIEVVFTEIAAPEIAGNRILLLANDPGAAVVWFDCVGDGFTDAYLAELDCVFSDPQPEPLRTIRRQVQSSVDLLAQSGARRSIEQYYAQNGAWPGDNTQAGLALPEAYRNRVVERLDVFIPGVVALTFGAGAHPALRQRALTWIPVDNGASIQWDCFGDIEARYLPPECGL